MKLRQKKHPDIIAHSTRFNTSSLNEILVTYEDGDGDSAYISEFEVWLPRAAVWKDMDQAFKDKDIVPDNHNVYFSEIRSEEDRERGYFP